MIDLSGQIVFLSNMTSFGLDISCGVLTKDNHRNLERDLKNDGKSAKEKQSGQHKSYQDSWI